MRSKLNFWLALVILVLVPALAGAQDTTAKIHGHVQDPANAPIANAQVVLSTDGKTALFTFTTDANGDYKGEGIKPDTYYVTLYRHPRKGGRPLRQCEVLDRHRHAAGLRPEPRGIREQVASGTAEGARRGQEEECGNQQGKPERRQAERAAQAGARRQRRPRSTTTLPRRCNRPRP